MPVRYIESQTEKPQTRRSVKKVKHWEDLELLLFDIYNEDGTKVGKLPELIIDVDVSTIERPRLDPFTFFAQFLSPVLLQSLSTIIFDLVKHWNTGVLSPIGKVLTPPEVENTALAYGDERGKAYIASIERFTKNIDPQYFNVEKHTDFWTRGAHKVYKATEAFLEDGVKSGPIRVECGQVCVEEQIEECKGEVDKYLDFLDLDLAKANAINCAELTRNVVQDDLQLAVTPETLMENITDFDLILKNQIPAEEKAQLLDKIKLKLLLLVRYSNDPTFDYGQRARMNVNPQQQAAYNQYANMHGRPMNAQMQQAQMQQGFNPAMMRARPDPALQQQQLLMQQQLQMQRLQQQAQLQKMQQQMQMQGQQIQLPSQMLSGQQIQVPQQMLSGQQIQMPIQQMMGGQQLPGSPFQQMPPQQQGQRNCANCGNVCPVNSVAPLCYGDININCRL